MEKSLFLFYQRLYAKCGEDVEKYWDEQLKLENQLDALGSAWWDLKTGPVLQECYVQLRNWNFEELLCFKTQTLMAQTVRALVEKHIQ